MKISYINNAHPNTDIAEDEKFTSSWFPLCNSHDLKRGKVISIEAFNTKLVIFRGLNNKVAVFKSNCCHIGTDLSNAKVIDNTLQCPLHHWRFDQSGQCVDIPSCKNSPPNNIKQPSYPCLERYGVVFVYNGTQTLFTPPWFNIEGSQIYTKAYTRTFNSSYNVLGSNAFDEQHLFPVHHRKPLDNQFKIRSESPYNLNVDFKADVMKENIYDAFMSKMGFGVAHIIVDCWGGNNLLMRHPKTNNAVIFATLPINQNKTKLFLITLSSKSNNLATSNPFSHLRLALSARLIRYFLRNDFTILDNMKFNTNNLLPGKDDGLKKWQDYWDKLPKDNIFQ